MRTKNFLYNTISTASLQIVTMIVGFIIPIIILRTYGSELNGLVTSVNQFIVFFGLVEAGIAAAAVYSLYKPLANNDYKEINSILTASKNFYIQTGFIFSLLVLGLAFFYPIIVTTELLGNIEIFFLVLVLGASGAIEFFTMAKYRVLLTASQKIYVLSLSSIISIILNTVLIAVLAYFEVNIIVLKLVSILSVLVRSLILHFYIKLNFKYVSYNAIPNNAALSKRWDALYLQVLGAVHIGTPVVVATIFTTLKEVSVYSIYNMVFLGISGILSIFTRGLSSSFGDILAKGEKNTLQKAYQEFEVSYYMIISWAFGCAIILLMPFIRIYTSGINDVQYYLPILGFLFVLDGILYNLKTPQGMLVISAGLFKETKLQVTIQALIVIFCTIIFAMLWGLNGILFGMILSNLYRVIDLLFFVPKNITNLPVFQSFRRMARVFITIIVCYIPFNIINLFPDSLIEWLMYAVLIAIYVLIITVLVNYLLDKKILKSIITRIILLIDSMKNKVSK